MFNEMEIKIANATSRTNGASARNKDGSIRAIVPKYVFEHIDKNDSILDFGAGKDAVHTKWLRDEGFNIVAYDFGDNCIKGLHDKDALQKQYKVIMASNVLNVSSSMKMLMETLRQIYNSLEFGGQFICNYPTSPRKLELTAKDLKEIIQSMFKGQIEMVGGSNSAPLWKVSKSNMH